MYPTSKSYTIFLACLTWLTLLAEGALIAKTPEISRLAGKELETRSVLLTKRHRFDKSCTNDQLTQLDEQIKRAKSLAWAGVKIIDKNPNSVREYFRMNSYQRTQQIRTFLFDSRVALNNERKEVLISCKPLRQSDCTDGHPTAVDEGRDTLVVCPKFWGPPPAGSTDGSDFQSVALLKGVLQLQFVRGSEHKHPRENVDTMASFSVMARSQLDADLAREKAEYDELCRKVKGGFTRCKNKLPFVSKSKEPKS
ncbi:hypothetical protein MGG_05515 [Pyricularia oryzae 70-15]|uniref:Uncharacterized protein n=1 Tax=Pyricularia oryzae (strain 70-15 / ATCC MYA-4617 / FGSC 8958) TaxID=242507 RepID=G4MM87_PYRO7|nr:uncharacterized protein MGG_05515 [Pyricularia oryzae 70-15]EHA57768.1 hypothetical protein MGG_05515 [Pyricularia oryzae 70-15]KAI7909867.1 hypothetical protein M9X92_011405 [Pyricularia oryzae]KAI7910246.1 hypothetical protein M0657_011452 [Pyricularia oryzae]